MKKLFIIMALSVTLLCTPSCRWIHETFYPTEDCAEWYLDEIYDAALDGDEKKASERYDQMMDWYNDLSSSDQRKADKAALKWMDKHPSANIWN